MPSSDSTSSWLQRRRAAAPRTTETHWRQAGIDLGWPNHPDILCVDLWVPHGQDGYLNWPYWFLGDDT